MTPFGPTVAWGPLLRKELPGERMLMQRLRGPSFQKALSVIFLRSILTESQEPWGAGEGARGFPVSHQHLPGVDHSGPPWPVEPPVRALPLLPWGVECED